MYKCELRPQWKSRECLQHGSKVTVTQLQLLLDSAHQIQLLEPFLIKGKIPSYCQQCGQKLHSSQLCSLGNTSLVFIGNQHGVKEVQVLFYSL